MMLNSLIAALSALAGATIGGIMTLRAAREQLRHDREKEDRQLHLAKLEQAYEALERVKDGAATLNTQSIVRLSHGQNVQAALQERVPTDRATLLIQFYVPELSTHMDQINEKWLRFGRSVGEAILRQDLSDQDKGDLILNLVEQNLSISSEATDIQKQLAAKAREYLGDS